MRRRWLLPTLAGILISSPLSAGAYLINLNFGQAEDAINHPVLYVGSGGVREIRVCLDPSSLDIDQREPGVQRALAIWASMIPAVGNIDPDAVPANRVDFETVILHELGHCLFGLAHPNLGFPDDQVAGQASQAEVGDNGVYDLGFGSDGVPGTSDDLRGDDVARVWFYTFDNYPYLLTTPVDQTSYSRELSDLPAGSTFAANPNRSSGPASMPPVSNTEAVMNAYTRLGEARRDLQHDDIATFLYAASGLDEVASTADDYSSETEGLRIMLPSRA